jgi:hypothetical protein
LVDPQLWWTVWGAGTLGACEITGATATAVAPEPATTKDSIVPRTPAPDMSTEERRRAERSRRPRTEKL